MTYDNWLDIQEGRGNLLSHNVVSITSNDKIVCSYFSAVHSYGAIIWEALLTYDNGLHKTEQNYVLSHNVTKMKNE